MKGQKRIVLKCSELSQDVLAVIEDPVFFENRKEEICARVFGVQSTKHQKVERIMAQPDFLVSGSKMRFVKKIEFNDGLDHYRMNPKEINDLIKAKNADAVYAF